MDIPIRTVGALVYRNEYVLLVKHGLSSGHLDETYGLPAGKIDSGESEVEACIRELFEETGLRTKNADLVEMPKLYTARIERKDGIKEFSLKVFICKNYSGQLKGSAETQPVWIKISDLDKYKLLPNVKKVVEDGRKLK